MKNTTKWLVLPCAALGLTMGSALVSYAATGWAEEDGNWVYYQKDGYKATDQFAKSGNNWYYLDDNGDMAKSTLIEKDDNFYYVNSSGAMVTNEWRSIENEDPSDDEPDEWWYYFQSNGKAVKRSDSSDNVKLATLPTSTGKARFIFNEDGQMMFGWVDENGEMLTEDNAWKSGMYYCGDNGDGRVATGWQYITAENDEDEDREGDGYYFYFATNGKKTVDKDSKKINGRKYRFDENGVAHFEWFSDPGAASGSSASGSSATNRYYSTEEECWLSTGWFKTVPSADVDQEAHDDDEAHWFYAESDGDLVTAQIKRINGQYYGFDVNGKMLNGLYRIEFEENGKTIKSAEEIEDFDELPDETEEGVYVYYFGDSPKEGAMKTGSTTLEIDGEKYYYNFEKAGSKKGSGTEGIDGDSIYVKGRRLEAEEGAKYQAVSYNGEEYLVNTSGKLQKNKKNIKDADDMYYITDKKGVILDSSEEKFSK